jgi:hypothetical protein
MTHEHSDVFSARRLLWVFLSIVLSAYSTHLLDAFIIKDRVDQIRTEQVENTKARIEHEAKIKRLEEIDAEIPHILQAQWLINRRLCAYLVSHGEADRECTAELWRESQE